MNDEEIYSRLGRLLEMAPKKPALTNYGDLQRWFGQIYAVVQSANMLMEAVEISTATTLMHAREDGAVVAYWKVLGVLHRALAVAELRAPSSAKGAFIGAGNEFHAMVAIGRVISSATISARIVDPYMDEKALTDFAILAPEGIRIELLSDGATFKKSLIPAAQRWQSQHGDTRPLDARNTSDRVLHDRLIIVDETSVYSLTQSLKDFAGRSPASVVRVDGETVPLKISVYDTFWATATRILDDAPPAPE